MSRRGPVQSPAAASNARRETAKARTRITSTGDRSAREGVTLYDQTAGTDA